MCDKNISKGAIRRMPKYYRYVGELLDGGVKRISSSELSLRMNVSASQVRQDLGMFAGSGLQGYGYDVEHLYEGIGNAIGVNPDLNLPSDVIIENVYLSESLMQLSFRINASA